MSVLPSFGLKDKVVIVTGAGRGLGRAMALDAFRSGARLAIGSRSLDELQSLTDEITAAGGDCFHHRVVVTEVASIESFTKAVIVQYGRVDVLINKAGYNKQMKIKNHEPSTSGISGTKGDFRTGHLSRIGCCFDDHRSHACRGRRLDNCIDNSYEEDPQSVDG